MLGSEEEGAWFLVTPSAMSWKRDGLALTIDGLHAMVEHPMSIPLVADCDVKVFEWYRDGTKLDEGAVLETDAATDGSSLTLVVTDETGRTSWSNGPSRDETK